jgi:hypothetical protein
VRDDTILPAVWLLTELSGRVVTPAVSLRIFVAEDRVCSQDNVYGICGGQCGSVASFSPSTAVCPCQLSFHQCPILINLSCLFYDLSVSHTVGMQRVSFSSCPRSWHIYHIESMQPPGRHVTAAIPRAQQKHLQNESPWSRTLEGLTVLALLKTIYAFYENRKSSPVSTKSRHWSLFWTKIIQLLSCFFKMHFNYILPSTHMSPKLSLTFRFYTRKRVCLS